MLSTQASQEIAGSYASRIGMSADEVLECVDTLVARPDPEPKAGAA
jgi:hypothetical protein